MDKKVTKGEDIYNVLANIAPKMLEAVKQVHSTGHIHRDIKADNFRVNEDKVYITDFGTIH